MMHTAHRLTTILILTAVSVAQASDFASEVVDYDNSNSGSYGDPSTALGRPTVDTEGDFSMFEDFAAVVPVFGPWTADELYRIGQGTSLTIKFDHPVVDDPLNPCGIDFIVFGNAFQSVGALESWLNGDPSQTTVNSTELNAEPARVSVSQDGLNWYPFTAGPFADDFAPTMGRIYDPDNYDPSLESNLWWGTPTVPTYPLNPTLTPNDFLGLTVAEVARRYGYSAGGTGYDLADLATPLAWIQYVRVEQIAGNELTPEIDAFADVAARIIPDFDCDSDVDADDLTALQACLTGPAMGPPAPGCERADLDQDGDVDQADFGLWQRCVTGPDELLDWDCMTGS